MEENLTLEKFYYNEVYQELANLHVPATHNNYGEVADWFKHHLDALQDKRNNDEDDTAVVENLTLTSLNLESESSLAKSRIGLELINCQILDLDIRIFEFGWPNPRFGRPSPGSGQPNFGFGSNPDLGIKNII